MIEAIKILKEERDRNQSILNSLPLRSQKRNQMLQALIRAQTTAITAMEKQIAKKPLKREITPSLIEYACPNCGSYLGTNDNLRNKKRYCQRVGCGQALDWQGVK